MRLRLLALLPLLALAAPLSHPAGAAGTITGVDVSKYQHDDGKPINWAKVKASGQTFAFIKATGGSDRVDPWFKREWAAARKAGMITGAYHYGDPRHSADAQAALVVETVGNTREANNLGIVLDIEDNGGLSPTKLKAWAHAFLDGVERRTGRVPILYTYVNFWHTRMKGDRSFGRYPLWLARYNSKAPEPLPGWDRWTFWQRTSSHRLPGIVGLVDHNHFCCKIGTLNALADGRSVRITRLWSKLGGASGTLGLPLGVEAPVSSGWGQRFERGFIAATSKGTFAVTGAMWKRYAAEGGASGPLGVPIGPAREVTSGVTEQRFHGGRILHSAATGAHAITGETLVRWLHEGGVNGPVGLPTGGLKGGGQQFVRAGLYRTPAGVRLVPDLIRDRYEELGGTGSELGLPTSEPQKLLDGRYVEFQTGRLTEVVLGDSRFVL